MVRLGRSVLAARQRVPSAAVPRHAPTGWSCAAEGGPDGHAVPWTPCGFEVGLVRLADLSPHVGAGRAGPTFGGGSDARGGLSRLTFGRSLARRSRFRLRKRSRAWVSWMNAKGGRRSWKSPSSLARNPTCPLPKSAPRCRNVRGHYLFAWPPPPLTCLCGVHHQGRRGRRLQVFIAMAGLPRPSVRWLP